MVELPLRGMTLEIILANTLELPGQYSIDESQVVDLFLFLPIYT